MASNVLGKNGHLKPQPKKRRTDIKIMVVGESKCGKSTFIQLFHNRNGAGDPFNNDYAKVYPCRYEVWKETREVKIYEIASTPDHLVNKFTEKHWDVNGFIFMYAINDRSSFDQIPAKWIKTLNDNLCMTSEPTVLVGNKKDLRGQQTQQRLEQDNQIFVTQQEGEKLAKDEKIVNFFECSSNDENDGSVHSVFHYIIGAGILDWRKRNGQPL